MNMRKHPDGTLYPDVAPFSHKWDLATNEEVRAHLDTIEGNKAGPGKSKKVVKDSDAGLGEKNPDACDSFEEAVAVVETFTANECDAYAAKLDMEPFGSRVKVADKKASIIRRMTEIAAADDGEDEESHNAQ